MDSWYRRERALRNMTVARGCTPAEEIAAMRALIRHQRRRRGSAPAYDINNLADWAEDESLEIVRPTDPPAKSD